MKKRVWAALLIASVLMLNGCRSMDKNKEKPVESSETVVEKQEVKEAAATGTTIAEQPKEMVKEVDIKIPVTAPVTKATDTDADGIPDYLDAKPKQHIAKTVAQQGTQKLIILDNMKLNSDKLSPEMIKVLNDVAVVLAKEAGLKVKVVGHTCDLGSKAYNMKLSKKRAMSAQKYLLSKKTNKNRVKAGWKGETSPIVKNNSEANRSKNRRVEIIFYNSVTNKNKK